MFNKKKAFTLTEILIALTIIGVIAALTVPMVMKDTTAKTNRVKVQKAFVAISDAFQVANSKLDYNTSDLTAVAGVEATDRTIEKIILKTMNAIKTDLETYPFSGNALAQSDDAGSVTSETYSATGVSENATVFKSADGILYIFPTPEGTCTTTQPCVGYIDINGTKGPNELITCTDGTNTLFYYDTTNGFPVSPAECTVDKSALTDIYPFVYYNATVKPANSAFETVLNNNND